MHQTTWGQQQDVIIESDMLNCVASMVILAVLPPAAHGTVLTYCVNDCTGKNNRDYNSCNGCAEFVTCSEGAMSKTRCPGNTFFDADKGTCDWTSNTCTETNSTDNPTTQSGLIAVLTTTAQASTSEGTNSTSSPIIQSNSSAAHTSPSQSVANKTSSSINSPTVPSSFPDAQTTEAQITDSQTSASTSSPTIQSSSSNVPSTTVQTTASATPVKTFLYIRVQYQTTPCVANAYVLRSTSTRSKIECGTICNRTTNCWYFQHTAAQCFMYELASPPCNVDVYRYDG